MNIVKYLFALIGIIIFFLLLAFFIQVIRAEFISGISEIIQKEETISISEKESLQAEVTILKQQLLLISRGAILRRTASGTEFVAFPVYIHYHIDEFIDPRKASSTAEILADDWAIKRDEERRKKEKE